MIEKEFIVPYPTRTTIDLRPFGDNARLSGCSALGLRLKGARLVAMEGEERIGTYGYAPKASFTAGEYAFFVDGTSTFVTPSNENYILDGPLTGAAVYSDLAGKMTYYLLTQGRLYLLDPEMGRMTYVSGVGGGTALAVHHERFFVAKGNVLCYGDPLSPESYETESEDASSIPFPADGGEIFALHSFDGDLYCFRKREVVRIRADAHDVNFSLTRIPFEGKEIFPNSVRLCGSYLAFRTERGLHALTRTGCRLVAAADSDFTFYDRPAAGGMGKYFAAAERCGVPCIWVYSPEGEYFLAQDAEALAGGNAGVYLVHGRAIYRLTPSGEGGRREYSFTLGLRGSSSHFSVEGITVHGKGAFSVTAATEAMRETFSAEADIEHTLKKPLLGRSCTFCIAAEGDVRMERIRVHLRRIGT